MKVPRFMLLLLAVVAVVFWVAKAVKKRRSLPKRSDGNSGVDFSTLRPPRIAPDPPKIRPYDEGYERPPSSFKDRKTELS